jgi:hypothetical protein
LQPPKGAKVTKQIHEADLQTSKDLPGWWRFAAGADFNVFHSLRLLCFFAANANVGFRLMQPYV